MSLISIKNLTFAYDGAYDNVFEDVSFSFDTDWRLGFIGRNGRGKTTFLNLLRGIYNYDGQISANVKFQYFPFEIADKSVMTYEVLSSVAPEAQDWEIIREISLLGVDTQVLYRPFDTLSQGERTKCLIGALFLNDKHFLLIDEPTNHLDLNARAILGTYLKGKKGFMLVSHDRSLLDCCCDHIISINKTKLEVVSGNFSTWFENKQRQDSYEIAQNDRLKKDINRLTISAGQSAQWSDQIESSKIGEHVGDRGYVGHMAAKMMKRSKNAIKRKERSIEEKSELLKDIETLDSLKLNPIKVKADQLLRFSDVSINIGQTTVATGLDFTVCQGDRVNICGVNGCGKSTLIKFILDSDILPCKGQIYRYPELKFSYVSQDTSKLSGDLAEFSARYDIEESLLKSVLRKLDFERAQFDKRIEQFSEGQKKKLLIAKSLCERANIFVWDEPLNFIDVFSRKQIEDLILKYQPTFVFVEHDEMFCRTIATKTVWL